MMIRGLNGGDVALVLLPTADGSVSPGIYIYMLWGQ